VQAAFVFMAEFLGRYSSPVPNFALMINAVNFYRIIITASFYQFIKTLNPSNLKINEPTKMAARSLL
jgi:hypothetical protein